jgi:sialidase-1
MTDQSGLAGVASVARSGGRLERFWVGPDRALRHATFRDGTWAELENLGGQLASVPAVTAWGDEPMEVFAIFDDGQLWDRYWDGSSWHPWESLDGELQPGSTPAAAAWGPERLDVIALGRDGQTWQRWWDGSRWAPWQLAEQR